MHSCALQQLKVVDLLHRGKILFSSLTFQFVVSLCTCVLLSKKLDI